MMMIVIYDGADNDYDDNDYDDNDDILLELK